MSNTEEYGACCARANERGAKYPSSTSVYSLPLASAILARMADNSEAAPRQAGQDAAMGGPDAASSQAGVAANTPPRTAPDRAAHARAMKADTQAHCKEVRELRVQQAAHARSCKAAKLGNPTQPKDSDK
ncbi:hypothetical protein PF007_g270 [Phytophthora fragariae]|uniref:Uncharacterized protein n=3 Tax=Phytophthora fragariae TaxID=53985 RepID=A0A6A3TQP7_9STRA|nr:hypothetical protein PF007_g270 [Phytophthora fragariae]